MSSATPVVTSFGVAQLNVTPGRKGLLKTLGQVPTWVSFQDKEKVEVRPCYQAGCVHAAKANKAQSKLPWSIQCGHQGPGAILALRQ